MRIVIAILERIANGFSFIFIHAKFTRTIVKGNCSRVALGWKHRHVVRVHTVFFCFYPRDIFIVFNERRLKFMEMLGVFAIFAGMAFCAVLGGIAAIVLAIIVLYLFDVITNDNLGQMIVRRVRIWLRNM